MLVDALRREFHEEAQLYVDVGALCYVSESYDRRSNAHFLNATFSVSAKGEPRLLAGDAHAVELTWASRERIADYLQVGVVREPLLASLAGDARRYYGYADAGITIEFAEPP